MTLACVKKKNKSNQIVKVPQQFFLREFVNKNIFFIITIIHFVNDVWSRTQSFVSCEQKK